jgi:ribose transport system permease protein
MNTESRLLAREQVGLLFDRLMEFKEVGIFIPFLVLFISVGLIKPAFFGRDNLYNVARHTSFLLPIAFMVTFVMVTAGIDISVGRLSALCGIMAALVFVKGGSLPLGLFVGLATGALFGLFNGWVITTLHIPPMIVTLGMMYVSYGIGLVITAGNPLYPLPKSFNFLGQGSLAGVPIVTWVSAAIGIAAWIALYKTPYGYWLSAVGGNKEAARRAGLKVKALVTSAYVLSGLAASIAGMLFAGRCSVAKPDLGYSWEMQAIAAVVIGGTSLFGGTGNIIGTLIGATIMSMLTSVLVFLRIPAYWQDVVIGGIIILAVAFDVYRRRIKYVPARIKRVWDASDAAERPDLDLVWKGAGLSAETTSGAYSGDGRPVLELKVINKYFGYVQALDRVDFDMYAGGQIHIGQDRQWCPHTGRWRDIRAGEESRIQRTPRCHGSGNCHALSGPVFGRVS